MSPLTILTVFLLAIVYAWSLYNVPALIVGIRMYLQEKAQGQSHGKRGSMRRRLPVFSVVVPAKNEEHILPRLLDALLKQSYPEDRFEVIVVEDGSIDGTAHVCKKYLKTSGGRVRVIRGEESNGKASALNRALAVAKGDILAFFDADSIPEPDVLLNAARCFQDGSVQALQGRILTANSEVNMLTKFVSYEDAVWCDGYLKGKDALGLFVHLRGSCQFIRRRTLENLGGWSENHLSEDMELSARLVREGHRIKYASDVRSWQESPERLRQLFHQRIRWFRGSMEVALKYGRLIRKPSLKSFDAEATLFGPFVLIISLLSYALSPLAFYELGESALLAVTVTGWAVLTATLVSGALALMYVAKPRKKRDLLWLPFIYAYWIFQVFLATWALIKTVYGASKEWKRTPKTGTVATNDSDMQALANSLSSTVKGNTAGASD